MERSKIFVPVFSKNYADSKWCLREIAKMVEIKEREGGKRDIIPVFYEVEPTVVKHCTGSFGEAFEKHKRDEQLDDVQINEWKTALTKAAVFSRHNAQRTEAKLITLIGNEVSHILCNVPFDIRPVGIGPCIDALKQMLARERDGVCMIGICGMGGIGKTTLAMALYNQLFLIFESSCFLSDIREHRERREHLPSLQAKLINKVFGENKTVDNVEQGIAFIKERFKSKKVLLVLDDVDDKEQLEGFTAERGKNEEWFGAGSKIIVTTRDKKVLLDHGLQEDDIYFPKELNFEDSLQLFCHHAFFGNEPPEGFEELSREVVKVAQDLPLALEVFGPLFCDLKEKQEWEEMLKKLKTDQHKKIYERLKISYDGLDDHAKCVFLDIACFFIEKEKEYPVHMWEACNYSPKTTLEVLQHQSLIKIDQDGKFKMHDQIRDMGKMIVEEKGNFDPLKYTRPWSKDQVLEVLMDAKVSRGNPDVQGIDFQNVKDEVIEMSWEVIEAMSSLRMIIGEFHGRCFEYQQEMIRLPSNLRWFNWNNCPSEMLAFYNDHHEKICVLDLTDGHFLGFRSHSMVFPNLKVLNLRRCWHLIRTPDFAGLKSLEVLTLDYCYSLAEMDESIGHLEKLVKLSMEGCEKLKGLPAGLCKLTSLESLDLTKCCEISVLPTRIGDLISLRDLRLVGTSISALPDAIGSIQSLEHLGLSECTRISILPKQIWGLTSLKYLKLQKTSISALPNSVGRLQSLEALILEESKGISVLPKQIGDLTSLKDLNLMKTSISALPDSIGHLRSLEKLNLSGCTRISILPKQIGGLTSLKYLGLHGTSISALPCSIRSLQSLEELDLEKCEGISILPKQIGDLRSLKHLVLDGTSIADLPDSIGGLQSLEWLGLRKCKGISRSALPDSIGSLQSLEALILEESKGISVLPKQIGDLTSLKDLNLMKTSISALPDSIGHLRSLEKLNLSGCTRISILPKQIGDLTSLKYLGLHGTSISALPCSIRSLQSLEELDLEKCEGISILPKQIGDLRSLKYLKLYGTSISALPDSIGSLQSLEHLYLSECSSLESLPDSIGGLKSLSVLSLYGCGNLEQLPKSMGKLTSLKKLDIRTCMSLREVPDSLGDINNELQIALEGCISLETFPNSIIVSAGDHLKFDGLKSLRRLPDSLGDGISSTVRFLSFNGCKSLEKIPESIGMRLECLEELDLSGCTLLTRIPQSIGNLKSLKRLILKRCQSLEELPAECISMLSLEKLDLSACTSIKSIPESIGDLKRLRHLSLEDCRSLKELPESMEGLESLKVLHIGGGMSVKKVPDFIRKLTNLQHLCLREIEEIPDSIGMLKSLEELHISACRSLRMIPESIGELNCLKHLILLNCQSLEKLPESMEGLKSLKRLYICGGMPVNKELPHLYPSFLYPSMGDPKTLVLSELLEITGIVGGFPPMEVILIEDCPKLVSLPQLPSSLTRLRILGCAAFRTLPDLSTLNDLKELRLAGCKALTDLTGLGSMKSLRELALIDRDGLSGDLMEKLSQTSFQKLERLLIYGVSDGSDLLFPLPKSKTGRIVALQGRCSLTEKLWFDTSDIEIRIQVVVEGKTVDEVKCKANRKDDQAQELGKWGLGGRVFYKISIQEGHKILMCVREGNPTCTSEIEEEPVWTLESEEEDYHPEAHKMLRLEEEGKRVRIGGWGMLRVPTNYSYGRLSMAFFEVAYGYK